MPFKSQAQRRLFYAKASRGEMPMSTVKKWESHTPKGSLPEKVASSGAFKLLPKIDLKRLRGMLKRAFLGPGDEYLAERFSRPEGMRLKGTKEHEGAVMQAAVKASKSGPIAKRGRTLQAILFKRLRSLGWPGKATAVGAMESKKIPALAAKGWTRGALLPVPGSAEAAAATYATSGIIDAVTKILKTSRRGIMKKGTIEFGFFDELEKLAQDDDLPSGLERIVIKGLKRVGKNADPVVVGKMREIMHGVPQERTV